MKTAPYIGITDFTSPEQVKKMLEVFQGHKSPRSLRVLHVGVMMSFKTLNGQKSKWLNVFPPKETIAEIFSLNNEDIYNCLHYADYKDQTRSEDLVRGLEYAGPSVHAVQLDMTWPNPTMVANAIRMSHKKIEVILPIGRMAIEYANSDPSVVVKWLGDYEGIIHRVLLDQSMGQGLSMNAHTLLPYMRAIKDRFPNLRLVVAGGLGPDSVNLVEPLIREFPGLSIDAQGKLRPSGDSVDPINWEMAGAYLTNALKLLQ